MAEPNPPESASRPRHAGGLANLRPWGPGQSGNPRGGAVTLLHLATRVRQATDDGQSLLDFYLAVLRGEPIPVPGRRSPHLPTLDQRMAAASWLADRGWGRAKEVVELVEESSTEHRLAVLRQLSDDERTTLRTILTAALERAAAAGTGRTSGQSLTAGGCGDPHS
jgi:hypothetical protein